MQYETVIGLEVHAQLSTASKIFCTCSTTFGAAPNTHTCPVCLGMPGVLPVLNKKVVEYAMMMALATGCQIAEKNVFARKNYFYPDLPKSYQISQFESPLALGGSVPIVVDGQQRTIGLTRIHMEEDAGKLIHDEHQPVSYVDLNRTGVPLIEIVSEPDLRSPEEAVAYLKALRDILVYLGICDGNMEEGSFRCDANVSLRPLGEEKLGTRAELKNMNSFRGVQRAIEYEVRRQAAILDDGGRVIQETRLWNEAAGQTESMRGKEESHDYRYFPDPDLTPVVISREWVEEVRSRLPELPAAKRARFIEAHGLSAYDVEVLISSRALADYFEAVLAHFNEPKPVANWIMSELMRELKNDERQITDCPVSPANLAELLAMVKGGELSGKMAKTVFAQMYETGQTAGQIAKAQGLAVVGDEGSLTPVIEEVIRANPKEAQDFSAGKTKLMGFFVGQVMKATKGQADPKLVNQLLGKMLKG